MTKILDPETRKDQMKSRSNKQEKLRRIKECLDAGKSDMATALVVGCSWIEVKAIRSGTDIHRLKGTDQFRGIG